MIEDEKEKVSNIYHTFTDAKTSNRTRLLLCYLATFVTCFIT